MTAYLGDTVHYRLPYGHNRGECRAAIAIDMAELVILHNSRDQGYSGAGSSTSKVPSVSSGWAVGTYHDLAECKRVSEFINTKAKVYGDDYRLLSPTEAYLREQEVDAKLLNEKAAAEKEAAEKKAAEDAAATKPPTPPIQTGANDPGVTVAQPATTEPAVTSSNPSEVKPS